MNAFFLEEVEAIRVVTEKFGQQEFAFGFSEITSDTRIVTLQAVGRLKGHLVGEPAAIRRRPLSVMGFSPPEAQPQRACLLTSRPTTKVVSIFPRSPSGLMR